MYREGHEFISMLGQILQYKCQRWMALVLYYTAKEASKS